MNPIRYESGQIRFEPFDVSTEFRLQCEPHWSAYLVIEVCYSAPAELSSITIHKFRANIKHYKYKVSDKPVWSKMFYYCNPNEHGRFGLEFNEGTLTRFTRWTKNNKATTYDLTPVDNKNEIKFKVKVDTSALEQVTQDVEKAIKAMEAFPLYHYVKDTENQIKEKETQMQPTTYNFKTKTMEEIDFMRISEENKDAKAIHIKTPDGEFVMVSKALLTKIANIAKFYVGYQLDDEWGWGGIVDSSSLTNRKEYQLPYHRIGRVSKDDNVDEIFEIIKQVKANERKINTVVKVLA